LTISVLVFDMDDTLYPESQYARSGFAIVGHYMEELGVAGFQDIAWDLYQDGSRGHIFDEALERLGVPFDEFLIRHLVEIFRDHEPVIRLHEDAEWILKRYRGLRHMALITDGIAQAQRKKIRALDLARYLDPILCTDEIGCPKPETGAFQQIMDLYGGDPEEYMYIGDNPSKDFYPGNRLGWRTAQILRADGVYRGLEAPAGYAPQILLPSLYELPAQIDS